MGELIVPLLNQEPAIVAYSWFSYGQGRSPFFQDNANLWDYDTNKLTGLGEAYFRLCNERPQSTSPFNVLQVVVWSAIVLFFFAAIYFYRRAHRRNREATSFFCMPTCMAKEGNCWR